MTNVKYPLTTSSWGEEEIEAIQNVVASGMYSMGEYVLDYEKAFAKYLDLEYSVMVNSGSAANLLMIAALFYTKVPKLSRGDEVIVPAVSWSTTYFPLYQYGLKLVFVDVDLHTLNMDVKKLEAAITPKTKAILAVNLLGNPNDFVEINNLIDGKGIILLEDNCESMGAELKSRKTGTFGLLSSVSTFYSHHMSTMEGGCVSTSDEELYHILLSLRAHGWTRNLPQENRVTGSKSADPFDESFKFVLPGYNVRPLEMSGAVGVQQLMKLPSFLTTRLENAKRFQELFANHEHLLIQYEIGTSSWFGFSLVIKRDSHWQRSDVVRKLSDGGIECRPIVSGNFLKNDVVKYFDYEVSGTVDSAEHIDQFGLFVGNHQSSLKDELAHLARVLA